MEIVYLGIGGDERLPRRKQIPFLDWTLHSFDLRANPIPGLGLAKEGRQVWNRRWAILSRKIRLHSESLGFKPKESTPLDLSDKELEITLGGAINQEGTAQEIPEDEKISVEEFKKSLAFFFRVSALMDHFGELGPNPIHNTAFAEAVATASFYANALWSIDKNLITQTWKRRFLVLNGVTWCVVLKVEPTPEKPAVDNQTPEQPTELSKEKRPEDQLAESLRKRLEERKG